MKYYLLFIGLISFFSSLAQGIAPEPYQVNEEVYHSMFEGAFSFDHCSQGPYYEILEIEPALLPLPDGLQIKVYIDEISSDGIMYLDNDENAIVQSKSSFIFSQNKYSYSFHLPLGGSFSYSYVIFGTPKVEGQEYFCFLSKASTFADCRNVTKLMVGEIKKCQILPDPVASIISNEPLNNYTLYPNPFSEEATIKLNDSGSETELIVYAYNNVEVIRISEVKSSEIRINGKNLKSGMYFYHLLKEGKVSHSGKFFIQHP